MYDNLERAVARWLGLGFITFGGIGVIIAVVLISTGSGPKVAGGIIVGLISVALVAIGISVDRIRLTEHRRNPGVPRGDETPPA